jgi:hypothetical protein
VVSQRGRRADWVGNIQVNPHVRINVRRRSLPAWRSGVAYLLDEDDARERIRTLGRAQLARQLFVEIISCCERRSAPTRFARIHMHTSCPGPTDAHRKGKPTIVWLTLGGSESSHHRRRPRRHQCQVAS